MYDRSADFEKLKGELRNKLAEIERDFPDAHDEIRRCRATVDEYCSYSLPRNDGEYLLLSQVHTTAKMGLDFSWGGLNRNKLADRMK